MQIHIYFNTKFGSKYSPRDLKVYGKIIRIDYSDKFSERINIDIYESTFKRQSYVTAGCLHLGLHIRCTEIRNGSDLTADIQRHPMPDRRNNPAACSIPGFQG